MPYSVRKGKGKDEGKKCVYKKRGKKLGKKVGCTSGDVKKYLAALYINVNEAMIKRVIREEVKKVLDEAIDPAYNQRHYSLEIKTTIDKNLGGEKGETIREIRGIPRITTVTIVPGAPEGGENKWRMNLRCKFVLIGTESLQKYQNTVLLPNLRRIKGLNILGMSRISEI
jgi:hypothetical protein